MYGSKYHFYRTVKEREMRGSMRVSKIVIYENPYVKYDTYGYRTGLKKAPKVIWKARRNGTWKAKNVAIKLDKDLFP